MLMNYDILVQIAEHVSSPSSPVSLFPHSKDSHKLAYRTLYALSLTSRSCSSAAAKVLYRDIVISPENDARLDVLDLKQSRRKRKSGDEVTGQVVAAILPHNGPFVTSLKISGFISTLPPPSTAYKDEKISDNTLSLPETLRHAILYCWPNLTSVTLTPKKGHTYIFEQTLSALISLSSASLHRSSPALPRTTLDAVPLNTNPSSNASGLSIPQPSSSEGPISLPTSETLESITSYPSSGTAYPYNLKHLHFTSSYVPSISSLCHEIKGLETLTIEGPTRTCLEGLPRWLESLTEGEGRLSGLHLKVRYPTSFLFLLNNVDMNTNEQFNDAAVLL
ncbi:hypothetical protein BDY19DRAFT_728150 [Irpex rosettiformis]|uniref:Uncharacterized protein n=1 Tax=Irpex rosettiformis TaxID=378272 RepID=A0ACB8U953_9APHY|nr:hypothetical protein BDY19DRAFT_728150 [Irpex rosettiformis]